MELTYKAKRNPKKVGSIEVIVEVENEDRIVRYPLHQNLVHHSPTGFQMGYGGSGPADLALNILYDYLCRIYPPTSTEKLQKLQDVAMRFHQRFKWEYVAPATVKLNITSDQIKEFLIREQGHFDIKQELVRDE